MFQSLGKPTVLVSSFAFLSFMFVIVMFFVNPAIDGGNGSGVLELQLSFEKDTGIQLIKSWGESGVNNFKNWIFADYIYAFSYSMFFASLIAYITLKKRGKFRLVSIFFINLAFLSGTLDCIENSMELSFIKDPYVFSNSLFFVHSIVATLKWLAVTMVIAYIIFLWSRKNEVHF